MVINPKEKFVVVSDHGMSEVVFSYNLQLEKRFGIQSIKKYLFFYDSVVLRVWSKDTKLLNEIEIYLNSLGIGGLLSQEDRKKYCVSNKQFGDIIYILNEGNIFLPNYFGVGLRSIVKGMHGYLPDNKDQMGVVISNFHLEKSYKTKDVCSILKKL